MLFHRAEREFGQELVEEFIRCLGIYPVGSVVQLQGGALALVVASDPAGRLAPVIKLLRSGDGTPYQRRLVVNLAALAEEQGRSGWRIRRTVAPGEFGLDPAELVATDIEFR